MPKYNCTVYRRDDLTFSTQVDAETPEEAAQIAKGRSYEDVRWDVVDSDTPWDVIDVKEVTPC